MSVVYPENPDPDRPPGGPRLRPTLDLFLLARYDEIEELARSSGGAEWSVGEKSVGGWSRFDLVVHGADVAAIPSTIVEHIAQHDPAYVLADIAAKRRVIAVLSAHQHDSPAARMAMDDALRALALPFSEHPDWREKWRP